MSSAGYTITFTENGHPKGARVLFGATVTVRDPGGKAHRFRGSTLPDVTGGQKLVQALNTGRHSDERLLNAFKWYLAVKSPLPRLKCKAASQILGAVDEASKDLARDEFGYAIVKPGTYRGFVYHSPSLRWVIALNPRNIVRFHPAAKVPTVNFNFMHLASKADHVYIHGAPKKGSRRRGSMGCLTIQPGSFLAFRKLVDHLKPWTEVGEVIVEDTPARQRIIETELAPLREKTLRSLNNASVGGSPPGSAGEALRV